MFFPINRRKVLTPKARAWKKLALQEIGLQRPTLAPVPCSITILLYPPSRRKQDVDNRNKATVDALQEAGIIDDDNLSIVSRVTAEFVEFDAAKEGFVLVEVAPYEPTTKRLCSATSGNIRDAFLGLGEAPV